MKCLHLILTIGTVLLLSLLSGCGGTQPPLHHYQLTATALPAAEASEPLPDLALGIGPVTIPEMLKRQEIVTRVDDNQYRFSDLHRWAGFLEKDLTAVIVENLGTMLGTEQIVSYPWESYFHPDYRIIIEILDLTGQPGGLVTLRAGWTIVDSSEQLVQIRKISEYQHNTIEEDISSLVEAESQVITLLCQEISDSLRSLQ